ncbi:Hypothetical protein R9X50_00084100 [Acrodontium crateriforme]|uniref:Uncharacterized protein n=1 Tax=Acrodontium crateriforme TaxID=150365 RepID=A0AAQ3LYU9_9PEZI|nr:Hypothetical protein R9X50_00084100 [Acrodontium crateriforme]
MNGNAFAQQAATASRFTPVKGDSDQQGPPAKRPRLSNTARCLIESHTAAEETALEVDHMILDYITYQATDACLASREAVGRIQENQAKHNGKATANVYQNLSLANNLAMADSFVAIFKSRHPAYAWDEELGFRIRLLQFTALFTQRLTRNPSTPSKPALKHLRETNQTRTMEWIRTASRIPSIPFNQKALDTVLPLSLTELERNRAQTLHALQAPAEEEAEPAFYGTASSISLLDLLPLFMRVSADLHGLLDRQPTRFWLDLAADFMLQACLEQYLVRGSDGTDAVDNAFAWGEKMPSTRSKEREDDDYEDEDEDDDDEDEESTHHMFKTPTEPGLWKQIKHSRLEALLSTSPSKDYRLHLENLARQKPIATFEAGILEYLNAVRKSVPAPVLIQREMGKLDDMSARETKAFFAKMI